MKKLLTRAALTGATAVVVYLMAANFVLHMVTGWQYGLFFDEFYYYSMSDHLAFGYMDVPPVAGWLMALSRLLLGDSVPAMRVFPALAGSFAMLFAALTARRMGGGRFAQGLTALTVMLAPVFMTYFGMFTYDAFDQLLSAMVVFMVARILKGEANPRTWVLLGVIAGIGLMTKITMGFLLICLVVGILLTRARKYLAGKWLWITLAIAVACFLPFIAWQAVNGFPIVEYLRSYRGARTYSPSPLDLLQNIFAAMNPPSVLLWLGGLVLLFTKQGRTFRPFAWAFLAYFALASIFAVRFYALAGVLLPLVAFGAVCLERNYRWEPLQDTGSPGAQEVGPLPNHDIPAQKNAAPKNDLNVPPKKKKGTVWTLKVAYIVVLCLLGAALTPLNIPVLSPGDSVAYNSAVGYSNYVKWDTVQSTGIPTFLAGRLGWEEQAKAISDVYHSLPEDEQKYCAIYCSRYGAVGAMDYCGKKYGLPPAISANMGAYYWGFDGYDGRCVIFVNPGPDFYGKLQDYFKDVKTVLGPAAAPYSLLTGAYRYIYICRGLKISTDLFWGILRTYT